MNYVSSSDWKDHPLHISQGVHPVSVFLFPSSTRSNHQYDVILPYGTYTTFQFHSPLPRPWGLGVSGCYAGGVPRVRSILGGYSKEWNSRFPSSFSWTRTCPSWMRFNCFSREMRALDTMDTLLDTKSLLSTLMTTSTSASFTFWARDSLKCIALTPY